jgi:aryl-alcohol dehydrogenase-like predicted oxidoreductase
MRMSPERQTEATALLDFYRAHGGNLFDTAEVYGRGQSEMALGQYFKECGGRSEAIIVSKGCVEPALVRPDYIRSAIDRSLERLGMDAIDLYLLHRDDPQVPVGELVSVLNEAVHAGKIRAFGGSNWTVARLSEANRFAEANGVRGFEFTSPHVGLATPREPWWAGCTHATREDLAWYAAAAMPILAWSSQCRGFFSAQPIEDLTYVAEMYRVYYTAENLARRERLLELARNLRVDPAMLAVSYALSLSPQILALVGPLSVADLERVMAASEHELSSAQLRWLETGAE